MYVVQIVTSDGNTHTYPGLEGPTDNALSKGIERFRSEYPDLAINEAFAIMAQEYYDSHVCFDSTWRGCCEICGGVIGGSPLYREINGVD